MVNNHWSLSFSFKVFKMLCMFTGQYPVKDVSGPCKKFCLCIAIAVTSSLVSFIFIFNILADFCVFSECGYYVSRPTNENELVIQLGPPLTVDKYKDYQKFVFTCNSTSGILSYVLMLVSLNKSFGKGKERIKIFSDANVSKLKFFMVLLIVNFVSILASLANYIAIMVIKIDWHANGAMVALDVIGLMCHPISWVCSLLGSFIFSKVAYDVGHECQEKLYNKLMENHRKSLMELINLDQKYVRIMKASLVPFGPWFAVH